MESLRASKQDSSKRSGFPFFSKAPRKSTGGGLDTNVPKHLELQALEIARLGQSVRQLAGAGQYAEALEAAKQRLALTEKTYGQEHILTATCLNDVATFLQAYSRFDDAEALLETARLAAQAAEHDCAIKLLVKWWQSEQRRGTVAATEQSSWMSGGNANREVMITSLPIRYRHAELAAVGDGENDAEMLRAAALGVAVANAGAAAMGAADVVVASNDAGGAAQAIRMALALAPPVR